MFILAIHPKTPWWIGAALAFLLLEHGPDRPRFSAQPAKQPGVDEVPGLLDAARKAETAQALHLLERALLGLQTARPGTLVSQRQQLVEILAEKAQAPADVLRVLGIKTEKRVARQLLYRRYLEQWIYDQPVPAVILLDCKKGQDPQLRAIFVP